MIAAMSLVCGDASVPARPPAFAHLAGRPLLAPALLRATRASRAKAARADAAVLGRLRELWAGARGYS
jgi:hypothetical protein